MLRIRCHDDVSIPHNLKCQTIGGKKHLGKLLLLLLLLLLLSCGDGGSCAAGRAVVCGEWGAFAASFCGRGSVAAGAVVGVSRLGRVHPDHAFASVHGHAVQERIAEGCQN